MSAATWNRHLPWLVALLVIAVLPALLATIRTGRWDDCAHPEALREIATRLAGEPTADFHGTHRRHVFQRYEGTLPAGPGIAPLRIRVVRSDEVRYPFDQQTRFLKVPMDPERSEVRWVEVDGQRLPVHLVYANQARALRVVASLFVYDGQPVDRLLPMQIRSALRQLVRGRRPITLFQADSFGSPRRRAQLEERAIAWLASGWSAYREICLPAGSGVAFRPGGS